MAEAQAETAIAELTPPPTDYSGYKRLTDVERVLVLQLHDAGLTQAAIAQRLDRAQSTVFDVIHAFTDSTVNAKRFLRGKALQMAENIVDNGLPRDHVQALKGLGVLEEAQQQGFTVNIGISDSVVQVQVLTPVAKVTE